jgi:sugar phosphate isomerase/epimerase
MRLRHPDGSVVHLAYCSNVHPAETVDGICHQLHTFVPPLRAALDLDRLGVGLWIPARAAAELKASSRARAQLANALRVAGAEVVTCNGFPYGGFHDPVVKHAVYRPDWHEPERLRYTLDLAEVLAGLLPDDVGEGTISTMPLGWPDRWPDTAAALDPLKRLAEGLDARAQRSGRRIRVGLEPEPGCVVETTAQAAEVLSGLGTELIGVCVDACHLAVQFEDPRAAVAGLEAAGVPVVKAQLSAAVRTPEPAAATWLAEFVEPRFLHQTRELGSAGVSGVDDLDTALAGGLPGSAEWRAHFHVPLHADPDRTTTEELSAVIDALLSGPSPVTRHLEVETYTWSVLPEAQRPRGEAGLVDGLAAELRWTRDRLAEAGLQPVEEG